MAVYKLTINGCNGLQNPRIINEKQVGANVLVMN